MDPDAGLFYTYDGKRLTRARVAGFALELAFQSVHVLGQFALTLALFAVVTVGVSEGSSKTKREVTFGVQPVHQQAIREGVDDVLPRLH